jgi:PGAP1-like protein
MKPERNHVDDLRGVSRLAIEATRGITALVEAMHVTIASGPAILGKPLAAPARIVTRPIYGLLQGVMQLIGGGVDRALAQLAPLLGASVPGSEREAVLAVLNGVLGDYLSERGNPLAIEMRLRHAGAPLVLTADALRAALPDAGDKLVVLVHGSCMNDRQWNQRGHDHGAALARDLGYTPIYVQYNSGLHISINGRALDALLEPLVTAWPVPLAELSIVGHSMGGLVARSACHAGDQADRAWRRQLRSLVTVGTPHHGAPLERGGAWVDQLLGLSRYSAPFSRLGQIRSAGVTDLRHGNARDDDWQGLARFGHHDDRRHPLPLPAGVRCYAIAGTTATAPGAHPPGDGLVPVDSALGVHASPARSLAFPDAHRFIAAATGHVELLGAPAVYAQLRSWLASSWVADR